MNANRVFKYLRPLPAVIVLGFALLALKGAGLALDARAAAVESGGSAPQNADTGKASKSEAPANDDAAAPAGDDSSSSAEVDVLTSLSQRRSELDARAAALDMRANLLAAAEKRVDGKIADLKTLQSQIETLLGERDAAEKKQIDSLVKVYSAMKPRDAGRIFNALDEPVLLAVAGAMKADVLAAIMAQMEPKQAQALTVKLAGRFKLPPKAELTAAAGSAAPASASPADSSPSSAPQQTASAGATAPAPQTPAGNAPANTPDKTQAAAPAAGNPAPVPAGG